LEITTLTLYTIAGALSAGLSLVLLAFARFRPGTLVAKNYGLALLILAAGFFGFGIGPALPRWVSVIATNMVLLSSCVLQYSGFAAFCAQREATLDRWGWGLVILSGPAFWYWGLIEPNGNYRSAVFSLACAAINARTAFLLLRQALRRAGGLPVWFLALLFSTVTAWMAARGVLSLAAEPAPPEVRSANPTLWITVFWYIVVASLMTVCVLSIEIERMNVARVRAPGAEGAGLGLVEFFRNKLLLLWGAAIVLVFGVVGELGIAYTSFNGLEQARLVRTTALANEAFAQHTLQVTSQVDAILRAVRGFHLRTRSLADTEAFIDALGFDRSMIDNVYLIAPDGRILNSHDTEALGRSVADRDYFAFHRATSEDELFVAPVEIGRVTAKHHFRLSRRLNSPDGRFGGIVLATVNPESFARYYRDLGGGGQNIAALLGTADRKLRARVPEPTPDRWRERFESPLWKALEKSPAGVYEHTSTVDGRLRAYAYRRVGEMKGYDSGADIYLTKPTAPEELGAAIRALSRRIRPEVPAADRLSLNPVTLQLQGARAAVDVSDQECLLLSAFAKAAEHRVESWQLMEIAAGGAEEITKSTLEVQIVRLRKKLEQAGAAAPTIKAIRGFGYQLCVALEVRKSSAGEAEA